MPKLLSSAKHAVLLLRKLGPRRFAIVLIFWILRRYRQYILPSFKTKAPPTHRGRIARDPILVYQMSKVGSTSLVYSLQYAYFKALLPNTPIHHAHTLTNLDLHEKLVTDAGLPPQHLALVREYKQIRRAIEANPDQRWNVLSLVRDPVARQVSDYFHHIDRHLPDWRRRWGEGSLNIDDVLQSFLSAGDPTLHWFEGEILGVLGIDVYATPFPTDTGYCLYDRPPKVSLLVIRLEDLNRVASKAVEEFLGLTNFKLYPFNLSSDSDYGDIYQKFKSIPLPDSYLENVYAGRLARHFYSDAELREFRNKWTKTLV